MFVWTRLDRQQMWSKHWCELSLIKKLSKCQESFVILVWPLVTLTLLIFVHVESIAVACSCKQCTNTWLKKVLSLIYFNTALKRELVGLLRSCLLEKHMLMLLNPPDCILFNLQDCAFSPCHHGGSCVDRSHWQICLFLSRWFHGENLWKWHRCVPKRFTVFQRCHLCWWERVQLHVQVKPIQELRWLNLQKGL